MLTLGWPHLAHRQTISPRLALSSRASTLFGEAFLKSPRGGGAQAWWRAVFVRHFLDELERTDDELAWRHAPPS